MGLSIDEQLRRLPEDVRQTLAACGFDAQRFREQAARLATGNPVDNLVKGRISPPRPGDIVELPERGSAEYARLERLGAEALSAGRVALVVLAGGMATRMGGVVKALVDALPGKSFLDLRLLEVAAIERRFGARPPLWLMTSHSTDEQIRAALDGVLDGKLVATFTQFLSLRLTPAGELFLDEHGRPSEHAPGHGDLPDALVKSGLLGAFVERGGSVLMVTNIDNLGGTLDPAIVGFHLDHGLSVTSEVVDKLESDRGGIPVRVDDQLCVLEEFRIPPSFDPATVRVFNTNVFHFTAKDLLHLELDWTFFAVNKKVGAAPVVQFERLVNEVTSVLRTRYLHMPRTGADSRFLPVKDNEELAARAGEIELVVRSRGILA
jgi:UTP--glucose-1-phosphate uridylyltransferase